MAEASRLCNSTRQPMRKFLQASLFSILFSTVSIAVQAQLLDTAMGPRVWLRANYGVQPLIWQDGSGHKKDATALNGQFPSSGGLINYNPSLSFDGVDDYLKIPFAFDGLMEFSVIAVYQTPDTTERGIWGTENAITRKVAATTRKVSGPDTLTDAYGKNENRVYSSTVIQTWTGATQPTSNAFFSLGTSGKTLSDKLFKGKLAELLVYNRAINFLERSQIETYLGIKYGIGHNGHNYVSSEQKVLWDADKNKAYPNNIAGIGHDDGYKLNQKQSGSAYDSGLLIISAGAIAVSNLDNKTNINPGDFLIWGDNGQSLKDKFEADTLLSVVQRHWMMEASGLSASQLKTTLQIDVSRLAKSASGYWLIIDRSGTGNFAADNVEYINATSVSNGIATYNVFWDKDGSGRDAFSFARAKDFFAVVKKLGNPTCFDMKGGHVLVEMVAGHAPFTYTLAGATNKIQRSWRGSESQNEEKQLTDDTYTVTITDSYQNKAVRNFKMKGPSKLLVELGPDQNLGNAQAISLDAGKDIADTVAVTYKWESSFGFNSTESKVNINDSGIYTVTVTRQSDGCPFKDEITINGADANRMAVFPVPVKSGDTFKMSVSLLEAGTVDVKVINASGGLVREMQGSNGTEYEFISSISDAGIYLVVITTPKGSETHKLIVD